MKLSLVLLLLMFLSGCGRKPPVENPNIIEDNPVRPKRLTEPLSLATNATNQTR